MDSNVRTIINYNTWERKDNFEFFKSFLNPQYSITAELDCTKAYSNRHNVSFFLKYLYAILRAANEITELRYRIEKADLQDSIEDLSFSNDNTVIVLYKRISVITPIRIGENGKFHSVEIPYNKNFEKFCASYNEIKDKIDINQANPYAAECKVENNCKAFHDQILVSSLRDINYTNVSFTQLNTSGSQKPLINVGKAVEKLEPLKDGDKIGFTIRMKMPIAICVHHGLCDGFHLSQFYNKVQEYLDC